MAEWNASVVNASHSQSVVAGENSSLTADVQVEVSTLWNIIEDDACQPTWSSMYGVDTAFEVYIDGVQEGRVTDCVQRNSTTTKTIVFSPPQTPGTYDLTLEVRGAATGTTKATHESTIDVLDPVDPSYDLIVSAPSNVNQRETFEVTGQAVCQEGDCAQKSWELLVGGQSVDHGTMDLDQGETKTVTHGPDGMWINEPGDHEVTFTVGEKSEQTTVTVNESQQDPPYDPLGDDDPDPPGGNGDVPWGALALAGGAAVVAGSDDSDSEPPDTRTE